MLKAFAAFVRIGSRTFALDTLESLARIEIAGGRWRNGLILLAAQSACGATMGLDLSSRIPTADIEAGAAAQRDAEEQLGREAAAEAHAKGRAMSYREAVDFAFEINGLSQRKSRRLDGPSA